MGSAGCVVHVEMHGERVTLICDNCASWVAEQAI